MFLCSLWFVHELSSYMYILQPENCFSALSMSHCAFSSFIIISRVLYIYFCGGNEAYVINMLCMHACLFIHLQQLNNFCEVLF